MKYIHTMLICCFSTFYLQAEESKLSPAYNAPAAIAVTHKMKKNFEPLTQFAGVSVTYWRLSEDGLDFASNGVLNNLTLYRSQETSSYASSFSYEPGFRVFLGAINDDEWKGQVRYTYAHTNKSTKPTLPANQTATIGVATPLAGTSVFVVDNWFMQSSPGLNQRIAATDIKSSWTLDLNLVDITVGRPYYQGPCLIVSPFGGLQAAFINQQFGVTLNQPTTQFTNPVLTITSTNKSESWGIGPMLGVQGQYYPMENFSFQSAGTFSLLATNFNSVTHSEDRASTNFPQGPYRTSYASDLALCPNASLDLGIGWSKYVCGGANHIDLSFVYEAAIYWEQNRMRKMLNLTTTGNSTSALNLFTQGLTVTFTGNF